MLGRFPFHTDMIIMLTELTRLLLSVMKMKSARLFRMTPKTLSRLHHSQAAWRGCSDMGLRVNETFSPTVGTIIIE